MTAMTLIETTHRPAAPTNGRTSHPASPPTRSASPRSLLAPLDADAKPARRAPCPSLFHQPALVVLGRDDRGRPHASWFDETEVKAATAAARVMGMAALAVSGEAQMVLANRLPHGRLFASGKAFVPFVKEETFEALATHLPEGAFEAAGDDATDAKADEAGSGDTDDGDAGEDEIGSEGDEETGESAGNGDGGEAEATRPEGHRPADWSRIAVGSLVLATEGGDDGWYESIVESVRKGDVMLLRWRDWPDLPRFTRKRHQLGLLPPLRS